MFDFLQVCHFGDHWSLLLVQKFFVPDPIDSPEPKKKTWLKLRQRVNNMRPRLQHHSFGTKPAFVLRRQTIFRSSASSQRLLHARMLSQPALTKRLWYANTSFPPCFVCSVKSSIVSWKAQSTFTTLLQRCGPCVGVGVVPGVSSIDLISSSHNPKKNLEKGRPAFVAPFFATLPTARACCSQFKQQSEWRKTIRLFCLVLCFSFTPILIVPPLLCNSLFLGQFRSISLMMWCFMCCKKMNVPSQPFFNAGFFFGSKFSPPFCFLEPLFQRCRSLLCRSRDFLCSWNSFLLFYFCNQ